MDHYPSCQSLYPVSAGEAYLDLSSLSGQHLDMNGCYKTLDLSSRPLLASELEYYHRRKACLDREANDRVRAEFDGRVEVRTVSAPHQSRFPPVRANNRNDSTYQQQPGRNLQNPHGHPRQLPQILTFGNQGQQQNLGTRREQRGYLDFEISEQKRRMANMDLRSLQYHSKSTTPQGTPPLAIPESANYSPPQTCAPKKKHDQQTEEQSRAPKQQRETLACSQQARDSPNRALLNAWARREAGQRQLVLQQRVQLPTAKPGNLHPGPSRISGPPDRMAHSDSIQRDPMSDVALTAHLKSKMASEGAYRRHQQKKEQRIIGEQYHANPWVPNTEPTRTGSVKQLLASVTSVVEQKVRAREVEVPKTDRADTDPLGAHLLQPHKDPKEAFNAARKCGQSFWHEYGRNYPISRPSDGARPPSLDSVKPLNDGRDHSIGSVKPAHQIKPPGRVPPNSPRPSDFRAAIEAIDKASGDLLVSPKTTFGQDEAPPLEPSILPDFHKRRAAKSAYLSLIGQKFPSCQMRGVETSPSPVPQTGQADIRSASRADEEIVEKIVDTAPGELDQWEWEDVGECYADDEWSDIEENFVDDFLSDGEWTFDVVFTDTRE